MSKKIILFSTCILLILAIRLKSFAGEKQYMQYISSMDTITSTVETEKYLWIGTKSNGLFMVKKKNEKVYHITHANSILPSDKITCIATKQNGEVYVGTNNGILRYDNYTFLIMNTENSRLASNNISSLVCAADDVIIAGTVDGGLTVFSPAGAKNFNKQNTPLASNHVLSLEKNEHNQCIVILENNVRYRMQKQGFILITKN